MFLLLHLLIYSYLGVSNAYQSHKFGVEESSVLTTASPDDSSTQKFSAEASSVLTTASLDDSATQKFSAEASSVLTTASLDDSATQKFSVEASSVLTTSSPDDSAPQKFSVEASSVLTTDSPDDSATQKFSAEESSVITTASPDDSGTETPKWNCTLPPYPKNGNYYITYPPELNKTGLGPGDKLKVFVLSTYCNPGYVRLESRPQHSEKWVDHKNLFACLTTEEGVSDSYENIECIPYCKPESDNTFSCSGEERCVAPPAPETNLRAVPSDSRDLSHKDCGLMRVAGQVRFWPSRSRRFVANGRPALRGELPWHAAIYTKTKRPYMHICGGSIISSKVVISAAHCFWDKAGRKMKPAHKYAVAVGKLYRPWNDTHDEYAQKSDVADILIPPRFHGGETNFQDDLALVIVTSPFHFFGADSFVNPVCLDFDAQLDKEQLVTGAQGKVAGWGLLSEDGPASPSLVVALLPVVDIQQCYEETDASFRPHITSDKFCAGYTNGTAVCHGDSGGGLIFRGSYRDDVVSRYFLRGVVSSAPSNEHLCNTFTWATFTHLLRHEHFIRDTIKEVTADISEEDTDDESTLELGKSNEKSLL